jgi:uncharacterized protein
MMGTKDLSSLLRNMSPRLIKNEYVFCAVPPDRSEPIEAEPLMAFEEEEGLTVILDQQDADRNDLHYDQTWAMITLDVHSDLEAVGFLAAVTARLAKHGISTNVVSAFFHDHIFVPSDWSGKALHVLNELVRES